MSSRFIGGTELIGTSRQRSSSPSSSTKHNGKAAASPAVPHPTSAQLPAPNDREGWRAHWSDQGQPWRTEPEIDQKRLIELDQRRAIVPDIGKGIYPFGGMKLNRADVEWLLAHCIMKDLTRWSENDMVFARVRKGEKKDDTFLSVCTGQDTGVASPRDGEEDLS